MQIRMQLIANPDPASESNADLCVFRVQAALSTSIRHHFQGNYRSSQLESY